VAVKYNTYSHFLIFGNDRVFTGGFGFIIFCAEVTGIKIAKKVGLLSTGFFTDLGLNIVRCPISACRAERVRKL